MSMDVTWWRNGGGIRCGSMSGRVASAGCRFREASAGDVWLWLNRSGSGLVWGPGERFPVQPGMYALTGGVEEDEWTCIRYPGIHRMEIVRLSREWLSTHLGKQPEWLHPDLAKWLKDGGRLAFCGLMGLWEEDLGTALEKGAEEGGGAALLAEARILEWAAVRLYRGKTGGEAGAGFCSAVRGRDPVRRALETVRARLDQPLELTTLAKEVGLAPHYLSRRVSAETGLTLQRHLRRMRIERACEWLASGRMNVTEAALEVGYQSLSHFAKAFREETGHGPQDWLKQRKNGAAVDA
ncbi:helix-turn-helix transcriptional regulator [Luteolibacter ambystomatis]|uniref:Helix-turn-helix transcriptional regulator n=1 Tax=Luteolibacter ambystomatis TaxID=2824561 RepID=A0A975PFT9_9BACT|nr:AraC family transcriptional regulator [Luteolibacter ambystomatis]QUE51792.1 helix-turn-helix transcriptional regulator [Luteolibacter ambystomatis]